jgi:hypothetical protein
MITPENETLRAGVGDAVGKEGEQACKMTLERACGFDDRLQARVRRPCRPPNPSRAFEQDKRAG